MKPSFEIKELRPENAEDFIRHLERTHITSGVEGTPIFAAFSRGHKTTFSKRVAATKDSWNLPVYSRGWERAWGAFASLPTGETLLIGDVVLSTSRLIETQMHRTILGIGIEPGFRFHGLGKEFMRTAILWAKQQSALEWIDLGVFAGNAPARRLYEHFGFIEYGRTVDAFRVDGHSVDDIQMSLNLRQFRDPDRKL